MKTLLIFWVVTISLLATASQNISCSIYSPCQWIKPVKGHTNQGLGYCVDKVQGAVPSLRLHRSEANGNALPPLKLFVEEISPQKLIATSNDGKVYMDLDQYNLYWSGGISIQLPNGSRSVGFFISCYPQ